MTGRADSRDRARFVGAGVVAGLLATLAFTIVHQLLISPIWFALPAMLVAGALCGAALSWSYRAAVRDVAAGSWVAWHVVFIALFIGLGLASDLAFEPVTTIPALLAAQQPPTALVNRALPLTGAYWLASAALISRGFRARAGGTVAIFVTAGLLILALGLNISVLGLVSVPKSDLGVLGEVLLFLVVLLGGHAAGVAVMCRPQFRRAGG